MVVGIVGLGLMGGSFGIAIRKYKIATEILGYDHNKMHQKDAIELNLVDKIVSLDELLKCDLIILSIPVDAIIKFLPSLTGCSSTTTIIDFGSTKELIVKNIPKILKTNFIPAHPMTGTEKFGPSAAIDGLYENKTMVLCDLDKCANLHKQRAIELFNKLKMNLVFMDSKEHDIHACYMSHLPHAISFALGNIVMNHENPQDIVSLAAGGFKDMSRVAKSSPDMWTDIFRQNRDNMLDAISLYEDQVSKIKQMIKDEDYGEIKKWMKNANSLHDIL
ncbi:MAG: prephenate dehydrogenase [Arcobacteraceae bacterium]|nr:prephenate dehydrogenase [Arcobacteraceae bacterium]